MPHPIFPWACQRAVVEGRIVELLPARFGVGWRGVAWMTKGFIVVNPEVIVTGCP